MRTSLLAAVAACVALTSATYNSKEKWLNANATCVPGSCGAVVCTPKQASAEQFKDCVDGGDIPDSNGISYAGMKCSTTNLSTRDVLKKVFGRCGGGGCANGKCAKGNTADKPKISCAEGGDRKKFTMDTVHVKPEQDTEMTFDYGMSNGKTCREVTRCSKGGTDVKPQVCAGATDVVIGVPPQSKDCNFEVSSIIWLCTTSTMSTSISTSTVTTSSVSTKTETPPVTIYSTPPVTTTVSIPVTTNITVTTTAVTTPETTPTVTVPVSTCAEGLVLQSGFCIPVTSTAPIVTVTSPPAAPPPQAPPVTVTAPPVITTTVAPLVTGSQPPVAPPPCQTCQPVAAPPVQTECSTCQAPAINSCPMLVPQCLQTFLFMTNCQNNLDTKCMCPQAAFAMSVFACIYGYGASPAQIQAAIVGFQGLCSTAIPSNPVYVTAPASYSQIGALPTGSNLPPSGSMNSVVATITTTSVTTNAAGVAQTVPITTTSTVMFPPISFTSNSGSSTAPAASSCAMGSTKAGSVCVATAVPSGGNGFQSAAVVQKPVFGLAGFAGLLLVMLCI